MYLDVLSLAKVTFPSYAPINVKLAGVGEGGRKAGHRAGFWHFPKNSCQIPYPGQKWLKTPTPGHDLWSWARTKIQIQWSPVITNPAIAKTLLQRTTFESRQNYSKIYGNKPRYNEPRYNKIPAITNWFWRSQRTIYPAITNILSCRSQ